VQGKINRDRHTDHPGGRHSIGLITAHLHHPPNLDINEAKDDGVAVASGRPYANHLHLALIR